MAELEYCETSGKIKYQTKAEAYAAAKYVKGHRASSMRVYECPFCKCWHLSHANRKARK